jgi:hypothetical protein
MKHLQHNMGISVLPQWSVYEGTEQFRNALQMLSREEVDRWPSTFTDEDNTGQTGDCKWSGKS